VTNLGNQAMEVIEWRMSEEFIKFQIEAHLGLKPFLLQRTILCT
jgi:hypothetical protein